MGVLASKINGHRRKGKFYRFHFYAFLDRVFEVKYYLLLKLFIFLSQAWANDRVDFQKCEVYHIKEKKKTDPSLVQAMLEVEAYMNNIKKKFGAFVLASLPTKILPEVTIDVYSVLMIGKELDSPELDSPNLIQTQSSQSPKETQSLEEPQSSEELQLPQKYMQTQKPPKVSQAPPSPKEKQMLNKPRLPEEPMQPASTSFKEYRDPK